MINLIRQTFTRQFEAVLSTLHNAIVLCPEDQWHEAIGEYPFWQVSYHALFFLDFYLTHDSESFEPRDFHRTDYEHFGINGEGEPCVADVAYDKATMLQYSDHCRAKISEIISAETEESLAGPSGFSWYPIPRAEFLLVNIRHVHHHAAQLSLHLRKASGIEINWVSSGWKPQ